MHKIISTLMLFCALTISAQNAEKWESLKGDINLFIGNDLGRNGYYDQKTIAELMGTMAETLEPEVFIAAGDVHHFEGVASVNDPLWTTNYELIYSHPELMIQWLPILGNHEYRGNTQAVLDYGKVSRRWCMPDRYYTRSFEEDGVTMRIVMIDTAPLIDKYRNDSITYPDARLQDMNRQLQWVDSVLTVANEEWVVVVGHHPIYAETSKSNKERKDMQARLDPILRKHNVDMYIAGHIHNFQHLRAKGSEIDYVVNSSGSLSRPVRPIEETEYCSDKSGFSVLTATKSTLALHFIDKTGTPIYTITRNKQQ